MKIYAPILLFVFSRPVHTKRTIDALAENALASESDLIVYSDAARNETELERVNQVRDLVKSVKGFRSVTVVERNTNYGLARNIIEGVSDACRRYGQVIVLEDDLMTSPSFLTFMNSALEHYEENKNVWHVSGWNYQIDPSELGDAFFLRVMNCWGWATWADRWQHFEKNAEKLISDFDRKMIRDFDLGNSGVFWSQVLLNQKNKLNTWAIFWYATIFKNAGLCVNPSISYVDNIGFDGSGTHGTANDQVYAISNLSNNSSPCFPTVVIENAVGMRRIFAYYNDLKPTLLQRAVGKFRSLLRKLGLK